MRLYVDVVRSDAEIVRYRTIRTTFWAYSLIKNCKQTTKMPQPNDDPKRKPLSKRHFPIGNAPSQPVTKNRIPSPKAPFCQAAFSFT